MTTVSIRNTERAERFRNAKPGTAVVSRDGSVERLAERKEDGSAGWWLEAPDPRLHRRLGLADVAFADGSGWELLDEEGVRKLFATRELHFGDYIVDEDGDVIQQVKHCTCGPAGLDGYGHEPFCGLEQAGHLPEDFEAASRNWQKVQQLEQDLANTKRALWSAVKVAGTKNDLRDGTRQITVPQKVVNESQADQGVVIWSLAGLAGVVLEIEEKQVDE